MAKKTNDEKFRTSGTAIYPPKLDEAIAQAIVEHCLARHTRPPLVGEKRPCDPGQAAEEDREVCKKKKEGNIEVAEGPHNGCLDKSDPGRRTKEEKEKWTGRQGNGKPMQCFYKGKHRTVHDGGGLCSPGRWPVEQRVPMSTRDGQEVAAVVKAQFLKWLLKKGEKEVKDVFWRLAGGSHPESPFKEIMEETRSAVDECLMAMGRRPRRREEDRTSEIAFRRLEAMAGACDDEDCGWLLRMAEKGVPLGVDEELPRVEKVFEPKEKWNLDFVEEALRDSVSENYRSAEESAADIERQVLEEVEKGSIVVMSEEEVKERYRGRLAVAALGAVPKELGSSVVRVTHDGSFSVDVNHRIKVRDRMRFPMIDDASAMLLQVEEEVSRSRGPVRFSLIYDIARAHKLVPVEEKDWGLQAFRLPGNRSPGKVYLHTRGTFGISSAAYW